MSVVARDKKTDRLNLCTIEPLVEPLTLTWYLLLNTTPLLLPECLEIMVGSW